MHTTRMFTALPIALLLGAGASPDLAAQASPNAALAVGDSIRVTMAGESEPVSGRFTSLGDETMVLRIGNADHHLPLALVRQVERGRARTRWEGFKRGFVGGAVGGFASGALIGLVAGEDCSDSRSLICFGRGEMAVALGSFFAAGGGTLFGLLMTGSPGHAWTEANLSPRITATPAGALRLAVSIGF